jgi:hypothetical protein
MIMDVHAGVVRRVKSDAVTMVTSQMSTESVLARLDTIKVVIRRLLDYLPTS